MTVRIKSLAAATVTTSATLALLMVVLPSPTAARVSPDPLIERGRYLVSTAGCNDCHTPNYLAKSGRVPEAEWLTGSDLGWHGPWGTTYASNLRLFFQGMSESQWLVFARSAELRPPMPWFNLRAMSDADLLAIHRYARAAGPAGQAAPKYLPPGKTPPQPFAQLP